MKKIVVLILSLFMFEAPFVYSMEKQGEESQDFKTTGWYFMIREAIFNYNRSNNTEYSYENISHVKRTGPFWPSKDNAAYDGYKTGQYLDVNEIDCNRKRYYGTWGSEILEEHVYRFWLNSPKIAIRKSRNNKDCIKVEIDTNEYDNNLLKRRPWYQKPLPVLCLATPLTVIATWYLKTWWDLRK